MSRFGARAQLVVLALLAAYFLVWPLWRLPFPIEIAQTEGWNAYHADTAFSAGLYPAPDSLVVANYPPLSFLFVGALQYLSGFDALYIGRVLSLIATLGTGALIWRVVMQLGGGRVAGAIAGIWFVATMTRSFHHYIGANEPQIVAHLVMTAALLWFLAREQREATLEGPVLLMVLAGFYKHNIAAVPLTAFVWLAARRGLRDWRGLWRPFVIGGIAAVLGLGVCMAIWPNFIANMLTPRTYSFLRALGGLGRLQFILPALILWAIYAWSARATPVARFTTLYVAISLLLYVVQWSGAEVLDSAQFDLVIAAAVGLGVAYEYAGIGAFARRYGAETARATMVAILLVRLLATTHLESLLILTDGAYRAQIRAHAETARADVEAVAALPGPVACDFKVTCRFAGKPFSYDDFRAEMIVALSRQQAAHDPTGQTKAVTEADLMRQHGLTHYKGHPESGIVSLQRVLFGRVE